jgi:hypothetical protein
MIAIVLAAVAATLTTWTVIGRALGQSNAAPRMHDTSEQHLVLPGEAIPQPAEAPPDPFVDSVMIFREMKVQTQGNTAAVSGQVKVFDRVPGRQYIWLLRVYSFNDNKRKLLREHHYLEDALRLAEGQARMAPDFNDFIGFDPGTYHVELTLYGVPLDFQFNRMRFGEDMRQRTLTLVQHFKEVVIE